MSGMRAAHTLVPLSARPISGSGPDWLVPSSRQPVKARPNPPATPSQPSYVQYGGLTTVPGPFRCADAVIYAFFLKADATKLDAQCQRVFGESPGGHFGVTPVGSTVMLTFGSMNVNSLNTGQDPELNVPYDQMGYSPEKNAAVWMLTQSSKDMAVFVPAMWVDNPISLTGGREIYGFAKNWGTIGLAADETQFSLDVYGGDFGPGKSTGNCRLDDRLRPAGRRRPDKGTGGLGRCDRSRRTRGVRVLEEAVDLRNRVRRSVSAPPLH